jgi:lipopolysaccharide transport system ATP-binding protein
MSSAAIIVDGISKQYQIGLRAAKHTTFREAIVQTAKAPFERLRRLAGRHRDKETFWALKDVSFEVQPGEVVGIIGRNGAGKSTLLKVLSRITEPTEGEVRIRGRVASLLEVGTGFHSELTGRENIYLNGSILGMSRAEMNRKFDEIVDFSGVEKFLDTPVKRYSSGMKIRLGFAVAANLEPEILIIDEVLAVGDFEFQKKCLGKMQDVADSGRTVLFVSHNMLAVRQLCQRGILIDEGHIVNDDDAENTVEKYLRSVRDEVAHKEVLLKGWGGERETRGRLRIHAVRTLNSKNEPSDTFGIFDPITIEADLRQIPSNGFVISFSIADKNGVLVYHVRSQDSYIETTGGSTGSAITVRMTIPRLSVVDGSYFVHVWVGDHLNHLEDFVSSVLEFTVVNRGHSVERLLSIIHETGQWELRSHH